MVRKVISILVAILLVTSCTATVTQAATYNVYENSTISSTYITYFKDILSGQSILSDYVAFRSGQYEYTLAVGDLEYNGNGSYSGDVKTFVFDTQTSGYNSNLRFTVSQDNSFNLSSNDCVLYSNIGDYPHLIERGANIETIQTILICIILLSIVINRIFYYRKSR